MLRVKPDQFAIAAILALFIQALLSGGCAVKPDETPESEVQAAVKTQATAKTMQSETDSRVKAGEDVVNGK